MKMKTWLSLAGLALAAALTGCQTAHQFATPDKTWKTHIGQLKYSDAKRTVIGDVVVQQRGEQEFQLEFQKAGGIPLLTLREDATTARADGLFARGSWQGAPSAAPKHLQNWVALRVALRAAFQFETGATEVVSREVLSSVPGFYSDPKCEGGRLRSVWFYFPTGKQGFNFQFNR